MRPLEQGETLRLPDEHECPVCGDAADNFEELDRVFGFRRMGDGTVRVQSYCHPCRSMDPEQRESRKTECEEFDAAKGDLPGVVYFISAPDRGLTKIGFTAAHPLDRLKCFQTANPDELALVGWFPSDYFGERTLHAELHDAHVRGEWFDLTPEDAAEYVISQGGALWNF